MGEVECSILLNYYLFCFIITLLSLRCTQSVKARDRKRRKNCCAYRIWKICTLSCRLHYCAMQKFAETAACLVSTTHVSYNLRFHKARLMKNPFQRTIHFLSTMGFYYAYHQMLAPDNELLWRNLKYVDHQPDTYFH